MEATALARARRRPMLHALVLTIMLAGAFLSYMVSHGLPLPLNDAPHVTGLTLPGVAAGPSSDEAVLTSAVLPDTIRRDELERGLSAMTGETDTAAAEVEAPETDAVEPASPFTLYAVRQGDTASSIAATFGVDLQYLLWANPDLRDGELLTIGQMLVVPAGNGILHDVRYGETLNDIAARYDVSVEAIVGWSGNSIASADQVVENALLFVPGGTAPASVLPEPTPAPAPTAAPTAAPVAVEAPPQPQPQAPPPPPPPPPAPTAPPVQTGGGLIWPVSGPISSYMDASHPLGIDIDLFSNPYAPIGAATSGTVTFAGGSPCCSYGLYVTVMSPGGIETLYAHLSSIAVSPGQQVTPGQVLGNAGCTGYCTGNHLHFEVIDNGVRVNPLNYLP